MTDEIDDKGAPQRIVYTLVLRKMAEQTPYKCRLLRIALGLRSPIALFADGPLEVLGHYGHPDAKHANRLFMNRRDFLSLSIAFTAGVALKPPYALADGWCDADRRADTGLTAFNTKSQLCNAYVNLAGMQIARQSKTQWCWAASSSMIFAHAGYTVAQDRIVARIFGSDANTPAKPEEILKVLNNVWVDDLGHVFDAKIGALWPSEQGSHVLLNAEIISTLNANKPILYCNEHHAMVLFQVNYLPPDMILAAYVIDPLPGMGVRYLEQTELVPNMIGGRMRLITTVEVRPHANG